MPESGNDPTLANDAGKADGMTEVQRQKVLLETSALQQAIFKSANFSCIATDAKGVIQIFNVGAERMLGFAAADVIHKVTPADISDPHELIARATALSVELGTTITPGFEALVFKASRGIEDIYELTYVRADGSRFPAVVSVTALRDAANAIIGYLLIGTDNTARKLAEEALLEATAAHNALALSRSDLRYRMLFESIDEGFCIIEMIYDEHRRPVDWRYLEVNPAFEKQTGIQVITGKRIRELAPDHEEHWFEIYGNVALTGQPIRFINEAKAIDGRWFDLYAFRVGPTGSHKVAVVFTDITERMRLNQALLDKNAELESARLAAETANRAKSDFLSNMSHELRSPLHAMLGFAQLIDSSSPPPTPNQKASVEQILQAGWYLLGLINEVLDLELVESGKLALSLETVSLTEVLSDCRAMIEPQAEERTIRVTFPEFHSPCFVRADRTRVKQVLINLLSNAIKYNRVGGVLDVTCTANSPGRMRISVQDSGAGLTAEQLTQLFQPFNRLGQEAGATEGTGIGLVMSKRLVELMGGSIGARSRVAVGSVFWIELDSIAPPRLASRGEPAAAATPPGQAKTRLRTLPGIRNNSAGRGLIASTEEET